MVINSGTTVCSPVFLTPKPFHVVSRWLYLWERIFEMDLNAPSSHCLLLAHLPMVGVLGHRGTRPVAALDQAHSHLFPDLNSQVSS